MREPTPSTADFERGWWIFTDRPDEEPACLALEYDDAPRPQGPRWWTGSGEYPGFGRPMDP